MYTIYVTNKLSKNVYIRLSMEKTQDGESYVQKIKEDVLSAKSSYDISNQCICFLLLGGFCSISPGKTRAFPVENVEAPLYVSVMCSPTVQMVNFPFNPKMHGCMAILSDSINIVVSPHNPEAVWLPAKTGDQLPSDIIKAGVGRYNEDLYFGRKASINGGIPCAVTSHVKLCNMWLMAGNVTHESGELLKNTGFELIRAKRGDPIPPNAVMTGVTEADGSLFVGRVGGSIPCHITTEDGRIQCFVYGLDKENRVANGEVMVLTH